MKIFILCTILFTYTYGFSQNKNFEQPNYDEVKKKITQQNTNYYYPTLLERFSKADTTMTLEEKRHLYYGFIYHKSYSPYMRSDYSDSLRVVLKKKVYEPKDLKNIIKFSDSLLKHNPFSLNAINYKLYADKQLKDSINLLTDYTKMRIITDAIFSSGDGLSKETAYFIISPTHEDNLLRLLGYKFGGKQNLIDQYDYLTLEENEQGVKGLYFNISASLNHMNNLFSNKE